jgi:hypothetical protein
MGSILLGLGRLFGIAALTSLVTNIHDYLQDFFGTNQDGEKKGISAFTLLLVAAGIVYFIYKVLGKKIVIK